MNKIIYIILLSFFISCNQKVAREIVSKKMTAEKIIGNPNYQAICYGGFRTDSRAISPTIAEIKEDLKILSALNIKIIRTYNVHFLEIDNLLKAITELKKEDANFEMFVMLGAWIDCKNAWTEFAPIHNQESDRNAIEIEKAIQLANSYQDIIKIIAVGNEAMVKWATSYYVEPAIILKWVNYLQDIKKQGKLPKELWITSSDNFASWGGGENQYHTEELKKLIKAVDYISMHTYPMHDTHYNPAFWGVSESDINLSDKEKIDKMMLRSRDYAISQYESVLKYMKSIGENKPVHIGETGWATMDNKLYGDDGSKATDEYKSALYYKLMRDWTNKNGISCFYFEAFDEKWKDTNNVTGSENYFGLINLQSQAKYALWNEVDKGLFKGMTRDGKPITKTYNGNEKELWRVVKTPVTVFKN
jgi:exo-beta-1,3-glucanase (GH17 family)